MAIETLYGPAASLLQGAADTQAKTAQIAEESRKTDAGITESASRNATALEQEKMQQEGGMKRQEMSGQQGIAEVLAKAKEEALLKQQEWERETTEITPDAATGMTKASGNPAFDAFAGKRIDTKTLLGTFSSSVKAKYQRPVPVQFTDASGVAHQATVSMYEDENGRVVPQVTVLGGAVPKTPPGGGKPEKSQTSGYWFKQAQDGQKELLTTINKKGGIPKSGMLHDFMASMSGGDTANDAKKGALKQKIEAIRTSTANYNALAEKEGKAPMNLDPNIDRIYNQLLALPASKPTAGAGTGTSALPEQAMGALKASIGKNVTFQNGQTWVMNADGTVKQVK